MVRARAVVILVAIAGCDGGSMPDAGGDSSVGGACARDEVCDDGLFCTGLDRCIDGACTVAPVECDDGDACTRDLCREADDACEHDPIDGDGDGDLALECGGTDCDDADPSRFAGNAEVCDQDHRDEDCDPATFGDQDLDGDGEVSDRCCNGGACGTDCDDVRREVRPGVVEVCDGIDGDCDGVVDDGATISGYADADRDLHGDPDAPIVACAGTPGLAPNGDDCDDANANRHGAMVELCDSFDNDCDGYVDETPTAVPWYEDRDFDGFGDARSVPVVSCAPIAGRSLLGTDCDDTNAAVSPRAAEECNGIDDDCNGRPDFAITPGDLEDDDGDGVVDAACGGDDCDDADPLRSEGVAEICDARDNDCDGAVDEGVSVVVWLRDADGDGYGNEQSGGRVSCEPIEGHVVRSGDCDDADVARYPGSAEICDDGDDDCDGRVDEAGVLSCALANAAAACVGGTCAIGACAPGFASCDGREDNGCERAIGTDTDCGGCGDRCAAGERCDAGRCRRTCAGDLDCGGGSCCGGTCTSLAADIRHCGSCGNACSLGATCVSSSCAPPCVPGPEACNERDDDCDGLIDDGACRCGDGMRDTFEACDDGNAASGDGCSADCRSDETCGNLVVDRAAGEQCDDGNSVPGDGCEACRFVGPRCGNRTIEAPETCDDGNGLDGDGCSSDCRSNETCGNGVRDTVRGEQCDDGNTTSGDGCSATCRFEMAMCGNGVRETGEQCDDGNRIDTDACTNTCTSARCGDSIVQPPEVCDGQPACSADCLQICGDGMRQPPEECDDGNSVDSDACTSVCRNPRCGDGIVQGMEVCDGTPGCAADCMSRCGDGLVQPPEVCDGAPGCSSDCTTLAFCGNGVVDPGEVCDTQPGCSPDCRQICGDGATQPPEECDDGNASNFDSCTNACVSARCGDGFQQPPELCDGGPGCAMDCLSLCGDGLITPPEVCDGEPGCSPDCRQICGDGVIQPPEICDGAPGCAADCRSRCGDGFVQPPEVCDGQPGCSMTCDALCGNNVTEPGEECDDGNPMNEDGCTNACRIAVCGDGFTQAPEECDDANSIDTDGCVDACRLAVCGDGHTRAGVEECDDGNMVDTDACTNMCFLPRCGDGVVTPPESCDDGGTTSGDGCSATCGDECGSIDWARTEGSGSTSNLGLDIDADAAGNVYLLITVSSGPNTFGTQTIPNTGFTQTVVWSLTAGGTHRWAVAAGQTGASAGPSRIAVDGAGNVYVVGTFSGTVAFGSTNLSSASGSLDGFVWSLSSAGVHRWAVRAGATGNDGAVGVDVDAVGNVYAVGRFQGTVSFGGPSLNTSMQAGFVWSLLGSTGATRWAVRGGGASSSDALSVVTVAPDGGGGERVVTAGFFQGTSMFGATMLTSVGGLDAVVWSMLPSMGESQWAIRAGGAGTDDPHDITSDGAGNLYVPVAIASTGTFGSTGVPFVGGIDGVLWSLDAAGGSRWAVQVGGFSTDRINAAVVLGSEVYVGGQFDSASIPFGATTLTRVGGYDMFVAAASISDGTWVCARSIAGSGSDIVRGFVIRGGLLYAGGTAQSNSIQFGATNFDGNGAVAFRMTP